MRFDPLGVPTPCHVCDERILERNLRILDSVEGRTGAKVLLALKAFALFDLAPLVRRYLSGVSASGGYEARLGAEEFGGEVHVCGPAYSDEEFQVIARHAQHVTFNSFAQWRRFRPVLVRLERPVRCGIRINPECSEAPVALYDPCAPGSRLGVTAEHFEERELDGISGLHFHTLCEQNSDALQRTLDAVEEKFGRFLDRMQWINLGGGHHITRPDYDLDRLCRLIDALRARHGVEVYLEPGEAVALGAGVLVATVLDVVENGIPIAILDASATAHAPDVLEMPYRAEVNGAGRPGEHPHLYRLAGPTCLAGDVFGDYSFPTPLAAGDRVVFGDMAHYTMVKCTTFNGVPLPSIASFDPDSGRVRLIRRFGYEDYRNRLS